MDEHERPPELDEWLGLARAGDEASARRLVEYLSPLVFKIVRSHLPRRASEEDVAQEVFMKIFRKLDQFRGEQPLEHWVARITHNTCLDLLRHQQRRPELRWADLSEEEADYLDQTVQDVSSSERSRTGEAREIVAKLLACLSPEDRLVVQLLDLEQKSVAEIQSVTGWGVSLVKVRAHRARLKLRKHLQQLLGEKDYADRT